MGELLLHKDGTDPRHICWVLERPWLDNKPNVSCIPTGNYRLEPWVRPSGQRAYLVTGNSCCATPASLDPDNGVTRWGILFHPGNRVEDSQGCMLPGLSMTSGTVGHSRSAIGQMRRALNPWFSCNMDIKLLITDRMKNDETE